jgi:anti-sigma factor RsiW
MDEMHDCEGCLEFLEFLSDYHDGVLDEAVAIRLELHMRECPRCKAVVKTLRQTIVHYSTTRCEEVPPHVHQGLMKALRRCMEEG